MTNEAILAFARDRLFDPRRWVMSDLASAPQALRRFAEWLAERGTRLLVRNFDSPNNQLLQAETPHGIVQVTADRGQWFVELAPPDAREYFDMAVWTACLTQTDVSLELASVDAQAAWLEDFLSKDAQADYNIECLREARVRRAYGRMGLKT